MQLNEVVPFGRSLDEYRRFFALTEEDLNRRILGVADGPASFNAEMTARGKRVASVDPLYAFDAPDVERRFHAVVDNIIAQVKATPDDWVWTYHRSPGGLRETRVRAFTTFLRDYDRGRREGRYVVGELPHLPFDDAEFDLALCSHFLFLYSDHLSYEFHRDSVHEMLRVAREVRIFPLVTLNVQESPHLGRIMEHLESNGLAASIHTVDYELQQGGNQMLKARSAAVRRSDAP